VDRPSDCTSINTGSVTVVAGRPTAVYNGGILRSGKVEGQSVAWAANLSDPLLRSWLKPTYNPMSQKVRQVPITARPSATIQLRGARRISCG